jgi:hypothetical protein
MSSSENISRLRKSRRIKFLIFLITLVSIVFMFPKGESIESEVPVGSVWLKDDLIATKSFPIYKDPEEYKLEQQRAAEKVFPIFVKNENVFIQSMDSLRSYNYYLLQILEMGDNELSNEETFLSPASFKIFKNLILNEKSFTGKIRNIKQVFSTAEDVLKMVYKSEI